MYRIIQSKLRCRRLGILTVIITIVVVGRYMPPSFSGETSQCDCALESRTISEELAPQQQSGLGSPQSLPHKNSPQLLPDLGKDTMYVGQRVLVRILEDDPSVKDLTATSKNVKEEANGARSKTRPTHPSHRSVKLENLTANFPNIARRSGDNLEQQRQLWTWLSTNILLDAVLEKKITRSTRTAMSILLGMEWLDEAEFFKNHSEYFSSNQIGSDFVMPRLLMGDTNRCGSDEPFLLMLVPSVGNDSVVREAIRRTWASPAYPHFLKWPMGVNFTEKVKLVFVFGRNESLHNSKDTTLNTTTTNITPTTNNTLLMAEQQKYGDIVQYDFMDTYRNLTLKMMTAFHWMVNYCSKATFVLKADMDTFVNVPLLSRLLRMVSRLSPRFVMGSSICNSTVLRGGKWLVNKKDYPLYKYPDYMVGHSYVITGNVIPEMLDLASQLPQMPIEDAFFTGVVAGMLRVPKMGVDVMAATQHSYSYCDMMKGKFASQTHFKNKTLWNAWDLAHTGQCGSYILADDVL